MQTLLHSVRLTTGAHLNVAARDAIIQNYHTHYYSAQTIDLPPGLKSIANFRKIHIATLGRATPGTGLWIFNWETFESGSTLMAFWRLCGALECRGLPDKPICVAYVYIRYSDHAKATVRGILEVLVKQMAERHTGCLALAKEVYASHSREEPQATEEELLFLLQRFTAMMSVTFYVLDALDEAPTDKDIELHIAKEISRSAEFRAILGPANAALRDEIVSTIKQKCRGMFLHAALQLDTLQDCTSVFDVKKTLEEFPNPIQGVYTQTWKRILDQPKKKALLAKSVLMWVLTATWSMMMEELQHAVATCPDSYHFDTNRRVPGEILIGLCQGLVDVESGLVHLVRESTSPIIFTVAFNHGTNCIGQGIVALKTLGAVPSYALSLSSSMSTT
ncbi:hypothetical protein BKA70DRAFT_1431583 [Coprinopsis sp. MPI-PUGE-AT-0042]|nr:hypothetical protein BKA70DRAFT_1431583 [Coprinopsis sp. MPI-PUGE-AT-0042]